MRTATAKETSMAPINDEARMNVAPEKTLTDIWAAAFHTTATITGPSLLGKVGLVETEVNGRFVHAARFGTSSESPVGCPKGTPDRWLEGPSTEERNSL
jgi:hypothetical protein